MGTEYTQCMIPYMKGTGKTKEQRQRDMCIGAKLCSGKASTREEAEQICINQPPKEPKPRRSSGRSIDPAKLATCVSGSLELSGLTVENLTARLELAITHCNTGGKGPPTYKRFMTACLKETGGGGTFLTAQADIKKCQTKWNETRGL